MTQLEREEEYIYQQYASGQISEDEYQSEIRELQRAHRIAAEESAREAYDNEMRRHGYGEW